MPSAVSIYVATQPPVCTSWNAAGESMAGGPPMYSSWCAACQRMVGMPSVCV